MSIEELKSAVDKALDSFIKADCELLWLDASERAISHKLAEHLQRKFKGWHVDCEYNRDRDQPKTIEASKRKWKQLVQAGVAPETIKYEDLITDDLPTAFPDIIVHRRNTPMNLLVIEIKKSGGPDIGWDEHKLKACIRGLRYQAGLFLVFNTEVESKNREDLIDECRWFER